MYIFQLMDTYSASGISLLWVCFFQTIAISWFFGADRFRECINQMLGFRPNLFWYICWVYLAPLVMIVRFNYILFVIKLRYKIQLFHFTDGIYIFYHQVWTGEVWEPLYISMVGRRVRNNDIVDFYDLDTTICYILFNNGVRDFKTSKNIKYS